MLLTKKDEQNWQEFVQNSEKGTIYHTLEWKKVLEETYNYKPCYLIAKENNQIQGILPLFQVKSFITGNRLVSLPFSYLGGPIATSDKVMEKLIKAAKEKSAELGCKYLELKMQQNLSRKVISRTGMFEDKYYISSILKLTDNPKEIWGKLHKNSIRRSVKKAKSNNLRVRQADSIQDLKSFYNLNVKTRKKHGVPTQDFRFFEKIWEHMHPNFINLLLAEYNSETIAAIILFNFKDTLLYAYGASDDKFLNLGSNNLLLWSAIESGCKNNLGYFDFGRTPWDDRGLLSFKKRWNTENHELPYYYYPTIPKLTSSNRSSLRYKLMTNFWKNVPTSISKTVGPKILKHLA